jgi:hypothetical protein
MNLIVRRYSRDIPKTSLLKSRCVLQKIRYLKMPVQLSQNGFCGLATFPFILLKLFVRTVTNPFKGPNNLVKHAHTYKMLWLVMGACGKKSPPCVLGNTSLAVSWWIQHSFWDVNKIAKHTYCPGSLHCSNLSASCQSSANSKLRSQNAKCILNTSPFSIECM